MANTANISFKERLSRTFKKWHKKPIGVKAFLIVFFLFFLFQAIIQMIPFFLLLNDSLKSFADYSENGSLAINTSWAFDNYARVFKEFKVKGDIGYFTMLINSIWQALLYVFVNLLASLMVAYCLSKFNFPGRGLFYMIMIFIQIIPIIGVGAAAFKVRYQLGMIDNPFMMWIAWAVGFDYSAFIMYGAFKGISNSYAESAEIDGAGEYTIFFKIILPQIFPVVLALAVENFVARWNDYTTPQINLPSYPNIAYGMFLFQSDITTEKTVYFASLFLAAIPGVLLYGIFQNFIIKNVSVGGIKG